MSTLTQPLKWHGGKGYLAPKIVALMPPHLTFVEPYAGGLSVMLAKDPEGVSEVANDRNGYLINFWLVLREQTMFERFRRQIEATPFSEKHYEAASRYLHEHPDAFSVPSGNTVVAEGSRIDAAYWFFVACRQSLAGRMANFAALTKTRTRRGMNEQVSAWLSAVDGLPEVHARLRRVLILNRDALDVIREFDTETTLFYLDPPYLHETRVTTGEYLHEMTYQQHRDLLEWLKTIKGRFMLSGYDSDLYRGYANTVPRWNRHEFDLPNNAAGGKSKRRMTEVLWCNF